MMQTQDLVAAVPETATSPFRARSSLVTTSISLLQITRCSDSASDKYQAGEINSYN